LQLIYGKNSDTKSLGLFQKHTSTKNLALLILLLCTNNSEKGVSQNPTILRFNVACIKKVLKHICKFDNHAKIIDNDWGSIIRVVDPDGNLISIRDSDGFQYQLKI